MSGGIKLQSFHVGFFASPRRYFDVQEVIATPGNVSASLVTLLPAGAILPSPAEVTFGFPCLSVFL